MSTSETNNYNVDLNSNTCPNREQRAGGINVYFGKASQIVKDAREGKLKNCERKFQQTSGCVLNFYLAVRVTTIRDAVVIFHIYYTSSIYLDHIIS